MKKIKNFCNIKTIFCVIFFVLLFQFLLKQTNGADYLKMFVTNGFIGYGLLVFYFIFFKESYENLFLFLFSNFLNILAIIIICGLITTECFNLTLNDNLYKFYFFTVLKLFPFFISAIVTELVFSELLNINYPDKLLLFMKKKIFRILIILNSVSLFFYLVYIHICLLAKGLIA